MMVPMKVAVRLILVVGLSGFGSTRVKLPLKVPWVGLIVSRVLRGFDAPVGKVTWFVELILASTSGPGSGVIAMPVVGAKNLSVALSILDESRSRKICGATGAE